MKSIKFLCTIPGAVLGVAIIAVGSVGVYALSNWFGGNVSVTQDASTFSVNLSSCRGNLPAGVNPGDDPHNIQFKVTGSPHISAQNLQQDLLGECEYNAVTDFYAAKFPDADLSSTGNPASTANGFKYVLLPARVTSINGTSITVSSTGSKSDSFDTHTFTLAASMSVYAQGQAASSGDLKLGDNILFLAYSAVTSTPLSEGTSILDKSDVQVLSIFKTHYDDGTHSSFNYQANNILSLDTYNQLPHGELYK